MEHPKYRTYMGVAAGIVTANRDTDGLGRIKVTFPWLSDDNETDWVRMSSPMAGRGMGYYNLPEIGDEVLIAFEHGDINHPYVIGALWNGKARPPEANRDGENNIRKIRSRSGHEVIFDDDWNDRTEKLEIRSSAGHRIVLDDTVGGEKIEIVDKTGNNKIVIDSTRNSVSIESAMSVIIKAQTVEIEGSAALKIKSKGIIEVNGLPTRSE